MISDFERASGPWHLEWAALPTAFIAAVGSLHQADFALSGLQVNKDGMLANLESTKGLIVAEAVMMDLAVYTGRQEAHEIVYKACVSAVDDKVSLVEALQRVSEVTQHLNPKQLTDLCDPTRYLGCCQLMVDELMAERSHAKPEINGAHGKLLNGNGTKTAPYTNGTH
jgi:adenylosuccinate lyase